MTKHNDDTAPPPPPTAALNRLEAMLSQLGSGHPATLPSSSLNEARWDGWGYNDTSIFLNADGQVEFAGNRYEEIFPAARVLPALRAWAESKVGLDVNRQAPRNAVPPSIKEGSEVMNVAFLEAMVALHIPVNVDAVARVRHSHGQTCGEVYRLRTCAVFDRVPDAVIVATSHNLVEQIVAAAVQHNVVLIPYGGGTNVSNALQCKPDESRMVVSLDMRGMSAIVSVDKENMLACVEAGITGLDLHGQLGARGVTLGHEPDSWEFSTVGGWVATKASGMKKNVYGNIEDLVVNMTMVTAAGTLTRSCNVPRVAMGPDTLHLAMGSEGLFGVVTRVTFRIRPSPDHQVYDSILFPTMDDGIRAMYDITRAGCVPASIRLLDNTQFQLGQALKPTASNPWTSSLVSMATRAYVTKIKGFDVNTMVGMTLLFEGSKETADRDQRAIHAIAATHGGMVGGAENGKRGYFLTYVIAYIRDFVMNYYFLCDSFETAVPWSNVPAFIAGVRAEIEAVAASNRIEVKPIVMCRVTQVYETGACVYVYYGVNFFGVDDPLQLFFSIEQACVEVMLRHGAALSHHHGIGKHRKKWLPHVISTPSLRMIEGIKHAIDPTNVFATNNIIDT
ncbi:hypothetical protein H257_10417 [Aphanomyces astaci]|uniref:Alkylglycerone-phosphate synthase n=1 Tax=Aphanomyces astaci TaxID=112090 RepID=W4G846_APHAT|nr:hypothetical protein H257_10417 [Aphanomyces astaci]ETV75214.1 hypothetical protein H257_10417 [Aphanomyces astaci]|eukprot:XP_009835262.1 hypothetical protein H257_10417 [Aphanomyces astaci]